MKNRLPILSGPQAAILDAWTGSSLVLGGPGTGKTSLIGRGAVSLLDKGATPWVVVRTREAASRLRNQIAFEALRPVSQPQVTTPHALARQIFTRFSQGEGWKLLTAPEQEFRVRELLSGSAHLWPSGLQHAVNTKAFASRVRAVIYRARQLGLDPAQLAEFGRQANRDEWVSMGEFFAHYLDVLDAEMSLDYAECTHRARLALSDVEVLKKVRSEFDSILVDDFTELDPAQIGLMVDLVGAGGKILATADPNTSVSTFRGAHPRAAQVFSNVFGTGDQASAKVHVLSQGYRLNADVVSALAKVFSRMPLPTVAGEIRELLPKPTASSGRVRVLHFSSEVEQANAVALEVLQARSAKVALADIAVIIRSSRQSASIIRALANVGISAQMPSGEIALADAIAVKPLLAALSVSVLPEIPARAIRGLLTCPLVGLDAIDLRSLSRAYRVWLARKKISGDSSISLPTTVGDEALANAVNNPAWLSEVSQLAEITKLTDFIQRLEKARSKVSSGALPDEIAWLFWDGSHWQSRLAKLAKHSDTAGLLANRDLDALIEFFSFAAEVTSVGAKGVKELLAAVQAQQIPADNAREDRKFDGVNVMTAHRARGREWSLVIVAGVQEGEWPNLRRSSAYLQPEMLTRQGLQEVVGASAQLQEQRRLFYSACATTKSDLVLMASLGASESEGQPSRFLTELGIDPSPALSLDSVVSARSLVSRLRRRINSETVTIEAKCGAAQTLAYLATAQDGVGEQLISSADPKHWWGVRELSTKVGVPLVSINESGSDALPVLPPALPVIRLSPSAVTSLIECPRRYFLARKAYAEQPGNMALDFGLLIHSLIEHAERTHCSKDEIMLLLANAWADISFDIAWVSAAKRIQAEAMISRYFARERHCQELGIGITAVEAPFELSLSFPAFSVELSGKIDRVEKDTKGNLRVVDFKTGRVLSVGEVAKSDQLGIYQLALRDRAVLGVPFVDETCVLGAMVFLREEDASGFPRERVQRDLSVIPPGLRQESLPAGWTWVHDRLHQAGQIVLADDYPALASDGCRHCPFSNSCIALSGRQVA